MASQLENKHCCVKHCWIRVGVDDLTAESVIIASKAIIIFMIIILEWRYYLILWKERLNKQDRSAHTYIDVLPSEMN